MHCEKCPQCGESIVFTKRGKPDKRQKHVCQRKNSLNLSLVIITMIPLIIIIVLWYIVYFGGTIISPPLVVFITLELLYAQVAIADLLKIIDIKIETLLIIQLTIFSLLFAALSLDQTSQSLKLTMTDINRNLELDKNIQESLFKSLNLKLDIAAVAAMHFIDCTEHYVGGSIAWQTRFPTGFEEYVADLRLKDENTVAYLIAVEGDAERTNKTIDYWNLISVFQLDKNIDRQSVKGVIWKGQQEIMNHIRCFSCKAKVSLEKNYGQPFYQPNPEIFKDKNPFICMQNTKIICPKEFTENCNK